MPPTSVSHHDAPSPAGKDRPPFGDRARELLGLEDVHLHGFFDDKSLIADDIDTGSLRNDGLFFLGALVVGMLLLGGVVWIGLRVIADAQHNDATPTKVAKATKTGHPVDKRSLTLSTTGLPVAPQVGDPLVLPVLTDDTSGVTETKLYDGTKVVSTTPGLASSITWTPTATGTRNVKVVLELDDGAQAVSPEVSVDVSAAHPGTSDVPVAVVDTAQRLIDAINAKNWAILRQIDPTKTHYSDDRLAREYDGLHDDVLVPVSSLERNNGETRLYAGLVAHETDETELFCVRWDVDPEAGEASQVYGRKLYGEHHGAGTAVSDVEQELIDACGVSG